MNLIMNPGTQPIRDPDFKSADKAAQYFLVDLGIKGMIFEKVSGEKNRGWFDYEFRKGTFKIIVSFPGSAPDITRKGEPWLSSRIYVDGSSWLWGYGLGIFIDRYKEYLLKLERED